MFPREQHINTNNLDSTDEQAGTRTEHKQKERDNKTTAEEHTLLFQPVPTNDRGWVEFNNGANFKKN
jgi:hypothetical protein